MENPVEMRVLSGSPQILSKIPQHPPAAVMPEQEVQRQAPQQPFLPQQPLRQQPLLQQPLQQQPLPQQPLSQQPLPQHTQQPQNPPPQPIPPYTAYTPTPVPVTEIAHGMAPVPGAGINMAPPRSPIPVLKAFNPANPDAPPLLASITAAVLVVLLIAGVIIPGIAQMVGGGSGKPSSAASSSAESGNSGADREENAADGNESEADGNENEEDSGAAANAGFKDENAPGEFPVEGEIYTAANGDYIEFFGIDPEEPDAPPYCVILINGIEKDFYWFTDTDNTRGNYVSFAIRGSAADVDAFYATLTDEQEELIVSLWNRPCLVREEGLIAQSAHTEGYSHPDVTEHYFFRP